MIPSARIGSINAATPTPLNPDGSFDCRSARRLARRWMDVGLDGVLLLGNMGEGPKLPDSVRDAFLQTALSDAGDRLTVFAGAADLSRERMLERALRYASMGVHYVVLCVPPGVPAGKAIADVKAVAEACPAPCCYYEVPAQTGTALVLDELLDLLAHENIRAMKDSSNNPLMAHALTDPSLSPGIPILDGVEYRTALSFALGFHGVLHGGGVLTARRVRRISELIAAGNMREAVDLDRRNALFLGAVYNRFGRPLQNVVGQKYALKLMGILDSETALGDQILDAASRERIARAVAEDRDWLA